MRHAEFVCRAVVKHVLRMFLTHRTIWRISPCVFGPEGQVIDAIFIFMIVRSTAVGVACVVPVPVFQRTSRSEGLANTIDYIDYEVHYILYGPERPQSHV